MGTATEPLPVIATAGRRPAWQIDGPHFVPVDAGCDLQRFDARFGRCLACPLPQCYGDMSPGEQARLRVALKAGAALS